MGLEMNGLLNVLAGVHRYWMSEPAAGAMPICVKSPSQMLLGASVWELPVRTSMFLLMESFRLQLLLSWMLKVIV